MTSSERRRSPRFSLEVPVVLRHEEFELKTKTQDVSATGALLHVDSPIGVNAEVELTLVLPAELTQTDEVTVRCSAKVIRVYNDAGKIALALHLNSYEFLAKPLGRC